MKNYLLLVLAAVALCFTACKKDNPEPTPTPSEPIAVTGVSLNKTMFGLEIGESVTVEATVTPENATNKNVEWSIADTAVATVADGVVTGVAAGETTLTVTTVDGGHTATIPVKVVTEKVAVTGIRMPIPPSIEIKESQQSMCIVEVLPANATDVSVKWSSSDEKVATVTPYAVNQNAVAVYINGVGGGTATITATTNDGGFEVSCDVTVIPIVKVTSIEVTPSPCSVEEGNTLQLKATVLPNDAENKEIEWSSSNTAVATVDANGLVTSVAKGEVTITATAKDGSGVKGIATITVIVPPTSVTFDGKTDQKIYTWWGKEVDLKAEVTPEGASLKDLTWVWNDLNSSSNPDGLKYNVTDDKATFTYTWPSQTSRLRSVDVRAFYGHVNTVYAEANVYFQTFAWLLKYSEDAINYDGLYPLSEDFNYKYNWENKGTNKLAFIAYYRSAGNENARPDYYKEYYIPTSEYTLTSSDPSKVKVTKSADGESWEIERLNTTDLVTVTLTYKCGSHTETYTLNLIP